MLYIIWAIVNIAIFIFFVFICFRATRLIRERLGLLAAVIFVLGLLSFAARPAYDEDDNKEPGKNEIKWRFASEDSFRNTYAVRVELKKSLIAKYMLFIKYGKDSQNINIPINADANVEGIISGTDWKPVGITITQTDNNSKFHYEVFASEKWKLLCVTVITQSKLYEGDVSVK